MSDQEFKSLVNQLKRGDNQCLKFIFEDHAEFCISNLRHKTGCTVEEAEDIFMDAIINFRDKAMAGKITYMVNVRNYIYTTCLNMQKVSYQSQKRIEGKREEVKMYFQPTDEDDQSENELNEYKEKLIDLNMAAFGKLGEKCQEILHLFYVDKLKMEEIATKLGFANANVVKTAKSRCYKKWIENIKAMQDLFGAADAEKE